MQEKLKRLLVRYREPLLYLIFGAVTTLVNWTVYTCLVFALKVDLSAVGETDVLREMLKGEAGRELRTLFICNFVAWAAAVLAAFVTNKLWVFASRVRSFRGVAKEFFLFVGSRVFSGSLEWFGPSLLVMAGIRQKLLGVEGFSAKLIVSVVVIVLNYVLSKLLVFREKGENQKRG